MTVALVGVGVDTTTAEPVAPLYEDGTFEFVPAPAPGGSDATTERRTFGNTTLRHRDGTMADYLDAIRPMGEDGPEMTGVKLENWPLHLNPDFVSRTYGEHGNSGDYADVLRELEPGDAVAFYSVLEPEGGGGKHRYLIGHFAVEEVVDFAAIDHEGEAVAFGALPPARQRELLEAHSENAHLKGYRASGELPAGDDLVVVEGTDPGSLLSEAIQISEHGGGGHYYLADEYQAALAPEPGGNPDKNAYLGGDLKAHVLEVSADQFRDAIE